MEDNNSVKQTVNPVSQTKTINPVEQSKQPAQPVLHAAPPSSPPPPKPPVIPKPQTQTPSPTPRPITTPTQAPAPKPTAVPTTIAKSDVLNNLNSSPIKSNSNLQTEKKVLISTDGVQLVKDEQSERKKKSAISKVFAVLGKIFDFMLIPICIFALFFAGSLILTKKTRGVPMVLGYTMIRVSSGSMVDAGFEVGDYAFVKRTPVDEYSTGDYIAFFSYVDPNYNSPTSATPGATATSKATGSIIIFHEIVGYVYDANGDKWFYTKGKNNAYNDANPIHENYVIGEWVDLSDNFMKFIKFLISVKGAVLVVVIPCGIILFKDCFTLIDIYFDYKDEKQKVKYKTKLVKKDEIEPPDDNNIDSV